MVALVFVMIACAFSAGYLIATLHAEINVSATEARNDEMLNTIHELQKALGVKK